MSLIPGPTSDRVLAGLYELGLEGLEGVDFFHEAG